MKNRKDGVLKMQVILLPILAKEFKISYNELSKILKKYNLLQYIDVCYEYYNSTGTKGIVKDIKEYLKEKGCKI